MKNIALFLFGLIFLISCTNDTSDSEGQIMTLNPVNAEIYFPPINSDEWQTVSPMDLEWDIDAEEELRDLLSETGTKAFIILKNGEIAVEWYFDDHDQDKNWLWASAGKTLTCFTVGIAQNEGALNINNKTSDYLGNGWTSLEEEQEDLITVLNQLTMTNGMNSVEFTCTNPKCLTYITDAGTAWSYHNGPYTLLQSVVSNATNTTWASYFNENLRDKIGMNGFWAPLGSNNIYFSTARSMARFGLLNLNDGIWEENTILDDAAFVSTMKNTSQDLNPSYGYLWWLNGKGSYIGTGGQDVFNEDLIPNAPDDLYAGLGANDQKLYIIPSQELVIVRMGEDAGESQLGTSSFDNDLWEKINDFINLD